MPLSIAFAESLRKNVLTIFLQSGWGWRMQSATGEWSSFEPPHVLLPVRNIELVQPASDVLGFTGLIESARAEFNGMSLMALTHTKDVLSGEDVAPLALALSPKMPKLTSDPGTLLGYRMIPEGSPAYLGFGMLVPTDIADKVNPGLIV